MDAWEWQAWFAAKSTFLAISAFLSFSGVLYSHERLLEGTLWEGESCRIYVTGNVDKLSRKHVHKNVSLHRRIDPISNIKTDI